MLMKYSNMEPLQEIKWAENGYINSVRLGVKQTRDSLEYNYRGHFVMLINYSNMEFTSRNQMGWEWVH